MKMRPVPSLPALALLATIALAPAIPPARAADAAVGSDEQSGTVIHLVQRAEKQMPRDRIRVTLRVEAEGSDPAKVQAEVNARMAEALAAAKRAPSVKAETAGYWVYQQPPPTKAAPPKWLASQNVTLVGKDVAAALALVGELQASGLLVEGLGFDLAPETLRATEDELTAQALAGLRARAERVAAEMKMIVLRYKSVEIGNATTQEFRPMPMRVMAAAAPAAGPAPAAEGGDATVSLSVDALVILAPAKAP